LEKKRNWIVGSRQSPLAITQTNQVIEDLLAICAKHRLEYTFEIVPIVTKGDRLLDVSLSKVGGKGLFVKEIEQALLDGTIDFAVHSMKDMPTLLPQGLIIGCIPLREDVRDAFISKKGLPLDELHYEAIVGTSSLRRSCQLKAVRHDFVIEQLRGNIDSRLSKLASLSLDGIVLAAAGLRRMRWEHLITEYISPEICVPAVGQGALALECREQDEQLIELLRLYHHIPTSMAVAAERAFLHVLNGGCQVPIGAYATIMTDADGKLNIALLGMVGSPDGQNVIRLSLQGDDPVVLGKRLGESLLERGADRILEEVRQGLG
jgi:hydroxymethylbilane synthase